jgi:hypothetical protein
LRDIRELSENVEQSKERTGNFNLLKFEEIDFIKSTYRESRNSCNNSQVIVSNRTAAYAHRREVDL